MHEFDILTWNVFHGRDAPPNRALLTRHSWLFGGDEHDGTYVQVNRPLGDEYAALIAREPWDVCLLQECPPAWKTGLAQATGANVHVTLTSRNWLSPVRRRLARWNPDLMGSWEGGSNTTLVRAPWKIAETRSLLLNPLPERRLRERRRMSFLRLRTDGGEVCVANLHLTAGAPAQAEREAMRAAETAIGWAGAGTPLVLGGDFNVRPRRTNLFRRLRDIYGLGPPTGEDHLDHLLARGLEVLRPPRPWPPDRRELEAPVGLETRRLVLSDHAPVEAAFGLR